VARRTNKEVPDVDGQAQVRRGVGRVGARHQCAGAGGRAGRGDCYPPPPPPEKAKCNAGNGNGSEVASATCIGGDPGNSFAAGNRGGDEGGTPVPNPGGNNVP
jgi:hypothetical protein